MQPENHLPETPATPPQAVPFQSSVPAGPPSGYTAHQVPVSPASLKPARPVGLMAAVAFMAILLVASLGFGIWAFTSRQSYKNDFEQKAAVVVEEALASQAKELEAEFIEREKEPNDTYSAPIEAASLTFSYPKTWSAQITEQVSDSTQVNGYLHPGYVPRISGGDTLFALRVEVLDRPYNDVLNQYQSSVKQGTVRAAPVTVPKVPDTIGTLLSGAIVSGKKEASGTMVVLPVRDKTIRIWTENNATFLKDFETSVLPSISFAP